MLEILPIFILLPLTAFLVSLVIPKRLELVISSVAFVTAGIQLLIALGFTVYWLLNERPDLNIKEFVIYKSENYELFWDIFFDNVTAVYVLVGALLTFMITTYSRFYMHREEGFKRFFSTILFFFLGYNIIIFSGNFETLFVGWEVLGISSFLLIAFYRDRYLPVRNAFKVYSIYRIGDVCLILGMWLSHHFWHHNVTFIEFQDFAFLETEIESHFFLGFFLTIMILITASVKSAQVPFSFWLPRAMEGPTPSSAIFYSSLSVHIGVFILLRTFPFWEHQLIFRVAVAVIGLITSFMASTTSNVQATVKSQIAYASIAQIGLIFVEVALGLEIIALIHFAGNAFLRTYQLLVSPSVVTYLIRDQLYKFKPTPKKGNKNLLLELRNSIYVLSVKEWNLDRIMFHYLWYPAKRVGLLIRFIGPKILGFIFLPLFIIGCFLLYNKSTLSSELTHWLAYVFSVIGFLMVVRSFALRKQPIFAWTLISINHFWFALGISFNEPVKISDIFIYLIGVVVSSILGYVVLFRLKKKESHVDMNRFYGHVYEHKILAFLFLLACLGLGGFPITPTFLGEDLIFNHIHTNQFVLVMIISISLIIGGLSLIRMYSRIFLGPHIKTYHKVAYRSS